ncbi:hypothetical protein HDU79_003540 [Rhizoclosmatium sp. JEL0117]|nr:hypothetical protein HDU79_003540 [Rhizoclosmatium sp. JEL0117]
MNGNDFLVTSWYQNGSCAPSNLFAYSFVPFPSCATAKPSDQLDGTCKQVGGKQTPTNFNSELCAEKGLRLPRPTLQESRRPNVHPLPIVRERQLEPELNVEDWSPNNRQLSRDESNINKIYLTRDGSVIKTFDVNTCYSYGTGSYVFAYPDVLKSLTTTTTTAADARPTNGPISDVGGPCQQAISNPAVCKTGLVCIPPAVALPGAAGSCQLPAATTTTTARNINSGASTSSVALGAIALLATLFA